MNLLSSSLCSLSSNPFSTKPSNDFITDTNNNDGVAKAIKKIIFSEE